MMQIRHLVRALTLVLFLPHALALAAANGPAETSLEKCQSALRKEGPKYVQLTHKAIALCLGKVGVEVLRQNDDGSDAAGACGAQFNKIGRTHGNSIAAKFDDKVLGACTPGGGNAHTLADLLGSGVPGVAEPANAAQLGIFCAAFGGDGSIDSVGEWISCVKATQDCAIRSALLAEFPRAVEWLGLIGAAMPAGDARNAVLATEAAMDGPDDDGRPSLSCGPAPRFLATGQATPHDADKNDGVPGPVAVADDGTLTRGAALAYVDNGDGTITDLNTGLMWEKKDDAGGLHDADATYLWSGDGTQETIWDWLDDVNAEGGTGFAGYSDWRIPNLRELESLIDRGTWDPSVAPAFRASCVPACAASACSCTSTSAVYWTSTAQAATPTDYAWGVYFYQGTTDAYEKTSDSLAVRAVRTR